VSTPRSPFRGHRARALTLAAIYTLSGALLCGCGRTPSSTATEPPGPPGPAGATAPRQGVSSGPPGPAGAAPRQGHTSTPSGPAGAAPRKGLTTTQTVAILAGAAAVYYLYNKHKNSKGAGKAGQYYLSKNGRVYYRDQNGKAVWVTPPPAGIQVPQSEAQQYSGYQGYNGSTSGATFGGYGAGSAPLAGGAPGPGGR
jgi:hypothetical protein